VTKSAQVGTEQGLTRTGLQTEIKLINGLKERKVGFAREPLQAGLLTMRRFLGQQKRQEIAIRPVLFQLLPQNRPFVVTSKPAILRLP
jgi:hypothetical protein